MSRTTPATVDPATVVTYDAARSTPYTSVYPTQSSRIPGLRYPVTHDTRTGIWRCPCPATVADCRHVQAAREFEKLRWWRRLVAALSDAEQAEFLRVLRSRLGGPHATEDDAVAYRALTLVRANRRAA